MRVFTHATENYITGLLVKIFFSVFSELYALMFVPSKYLKVVLNDILSSKHHACAWVLASVVLAKSII